MTRKRILMTAVAVAVVVWLGWQFHHSPEWQKFTWTAVWDATRGTKGWYILASVLLIYVSFPLRTWRWQALMTPNGRFWPVFRGTVLGFTGTALLGRAGELVRPYYIARKHGSSISPQLAVWVLERVLDMSAVVLLVGLDLGFNPVVKQITRSGGYQAAFQRAGLIVIAAIVALVVLLYIFHLRVQALLAWMQRRQERHARSWRTKLMHFFETLSQGMSGLGRGSLLAGVVATTFALWLVISAAVWLAVLAYPGMVPGFSFGEGLLLMGLTAVGSVAQLPGVGGGFQVLTLFGLTKLFGADTASATSAALLIWLICIYSIAPWGVGLAMHEGVSWSGMERQAEAEEGLAGG